MYNIKLTDYIPEPEPVSSDFIVAAHYYSAWKKGAAELHNAFYDIKEYPERTPLMGYYDEENPEVCDWEIKWAVEHGVNCFIHCWYRRKENMGKPVTVDALRCGHGLHEALFNARFGKYMKFAIMYEAQTRWGGTDEKDLIDNLMPFWTENYFKRDNYLIINNCPVLFVYDTKKQIEKAFETPEAQKKAFDACRNYAVKAGFAGLYIAVQDNTSSIEELKKYYERGYDFHFAYNWWMGYFEDRTSEKCIAEQYRIQKERAEAFPYGFNTTASAFWDPKPRVKTMSYIDDPWYIYPNDFRKVLRNCRQLAEQMPEDSVGRKLIMIDNWNEWDEGHFVSPSHEFGFKYLEAIREELTKRDNLPDYRMPQDIGFSGYNKSWGEPDLSEICRKKFGLK